MTPKEKCDQLIEKFRPYVYCYIGSGMLSDTYDLEVANSYAKECALISVKETIESFELYGNDLMGEINYWEEVKGELEKL